MHEQEAIRRRIFLSHRGVDKALVRGYKLTLELLGLEPWLDEDDMPAGSELERGLQLGMKNSCAAVFFVTPAFADERYLKAEVGYAVTEKRHREDAFAIIALVLKDAQGNFGRVPSLLEPYVWKQPESDLQALREIIRALPEHARDIGPRAKLASVPDLRVLVKEGQLVSPGEPTIDVMSVTVENHDAVPVFLTGGVSADRRDNDTFLWFRVDALGQHHYPSKLEPGASLNVLLKESDLSQVTGIVRTFFFSDQIGRRFHSNEVDTRTTLDAVARRRNAG